MTRWNRYISQLLPFSSLISNAASVQNNLAHARRAMCAVTLIADRTSQDGDCASLPAPRSGLASATTNIAREFMIKASMTFVNA